LCPRPGTHGGCLDFEPGSEALFRDQPYRSRAARFGIAQEVGCHWKSLRDSRVYALTMHEWLWCYRAHCMQAQRLQFDPKFRSATIARAGVVLLVSVPLLLIGRSWCGTPDI
jgi:hypothetical protein